MTVAEDATTMEEVQAEALVAEEVRLQEEKEILLQDAKADSEATVHQLPEKVDLRQEPVLHVVKADFHQTARQDELTLQERKVLLKEHQDVLKVSAIPSQNVQERAKRKSFS